MARVPFDTVATFNDKKNNNNVSVNIALQPLLKKLPKQQQPQQLPQSPSYDHVPQPPHLRVDKSTITDPETEAEFQKQHQNQRKQKSRLHSVLDSLKSVFQWTTHSISGGMRNSESFIVENGNFAFHRFFFADSFVFFEREKFACRLVKHKLPTALSLHVVPFDKGIFLVPWENRF